MSDEPKPWCSSCRRVRPCPGVGPQPADFAFIGEGPGEAEDWKRIPFIGPSGKELNYNLLPLAGLVREDVWVTNAIKCRQGKKDGDDPDPNEVLTCAKHHLPGEFAKVKPKVVVTLGAHALRLFGKHSLEMVHGRPLYKQRFENWEGTVFPIHHPAIGLHSSNFLVDLESDFKALREFRYGKLVVPRDEYPNPEYRHLRTRDDFINVLRAANAHHGGKWLAAPWVEIAVDTETDAGKFWCLTFSILPGTGYMIRADNHELLAEFRAFLKATRPLVIFHNYLFDVAVLRQAEIVCPRFIDTMQMAFERGIMPKSLKVLAYRYLGMEMEEYNDVVLPHAHAEAIGYLDLASKKEMPELIERLPWKHKKFRCSGGKKYGGKHPPVQIVITEPGTRRCLLCSNVKKSGSMEHSRGGKQFIWERAKKLLREVMEEGADPIARWYAIQGPDRAVMEAHLGLMPLPSIAQVPFDQAVWYACRDSDATIRIKPVIRRVGGAVGRSAR